MITSTELDGIYNYGGASCVPVGCQAFAGTFKLTNSTWRSCFGEDYSDTCPDNRSGTINSLGNGKFQLLRDGNVNVGTALVVGTGVNRTLLVDLQDFRSGGVGRGMLLGPLQRAQTTTEADGVYVGVTSNSQVYAAEFAGNNVRVRGTNGRRGAGTINYNTPFNGISRFVPNNASGDAIVISGQGLYVALDPNQQASSFEFGLKVPAALGKTFEQVAANTRSNSNGTTVASRTGPTQ